MGASFAHQDPLGHRPDLGGAGSSESQHPWRRVRGLPGATQKCRPQLRLLGPQSGVWEEGRCLRPALMLRVLVESGGKDNVLAGWRLGAFGEAGAAAWKRVDGPCRGDAVRAQLEVKLQVLFRVGGWA